MVRKHSPLWFDCFSGWTHCCPSRGATIWPWGWVIYLDSTTHVCNFLNFFLQWNTEYNWNIPWYKMYFIPPTYVNYWIVYSMLEVLVISALIQAGRRTLDAKAIWHIIWSQGVVFRCWLNNMSIWECKMVEFSLKKSNHTFWHAKIISHWELPWVSSQFHPGLCSSAGGWFTLIWFIFSLWPCPWPCP